MRTLLALTVSLTACVAEPPADEVSMSGDQDDQDNEVAPPVRTEASTAAWLATGEYLTWRCEDSHPARPGSGHGRNRICSNEPLATTPDGIPFPIGAANVKELLDDSDQILGYAFMEKAAESGDGSGWYFYERLGTTTYAASYGAGLCAGCHSTAPHDFAFTVVR